MGQTRAEREWLELVADLLTDPPDALPDERIALAMCDTFGLSGCSYADAVPAEWGALRLWPREQQFGGLREELVSWTAMRAPVEHPLLLHYHHTGCREPLQLEDVPHRRWGTWAELSAAVGVTHQLALPLRLGPRRHRSFVLGRTEVFGPQEVAPAHQLWRLLSGLDRQLDALGRLRPGRPTDLGLTPREQAVLGLLTEGLTAAAIGRRLLVTERTVAQASRTRLPQARGVRPAQCGAAGPRARLLAASSGHDLHHVPAAQ